MITLSINRSTAAAATSTPGLAKGFMTSAGSAKRTLTPMPQVPALSVPAAAKVSSNPNTPLLLRVFQWFNAKRIARPAKQLAVAETVSLGEKRFVSVVTVGNRQFLIGGGPTNVQLLAELGETETASATLAKTATKALASETSFAKTLKKTAAPKAIASKPRKAALPAPAAASHRVLPVVAAKVLPAPSAPRCIPAGNTQRAAHSTSGQTASRRRKGVKVFVAGGLA
ncbi:MAG TPA: flagellar biosynthetic protein FliO [Acidobacteriaceae bacterium]|jgi:flagellar biogenesis protein FliO